MTDFNTLVLPEWELLVSEAINWGVGITYSHEDVAETMKLKQCSRKYYNSVNKAIKELTRRGVRLSNVKNVGYKVLTPDEWEVEANSKIKRGGKHIEEAFSIITYAPLLQMSEGSRLSCLKMHDLIVKQKFILSGGLVEFKTESKNIHQLRGGSEL